MQNFCVNLLSLNKELKKGFKVSNDGAAVSLNYMHVKLTFYCVINSTDSFVTEVLMKPISFNNINNGRTYVINHFPKLFGHCGQETLNNNVKMYGFKSSGNFETCEQCAIAKERQKNVNKNWLGSCNASGERLYIDISSIKEEEVSEEQSSWLLLLEFCDEEQVGYQRKDQECIEQFKYY
jgi:hypothetical protein